MGCACTKDSKIVESCNSSKGRNTFITSYGLVIMHKSACSVKIACGQYVRRKPSLLNLLPTDAERAGNFASSRTWPYHRHGIQRHRDGANQEYGGVLVSRQAWGDAAYRALQLQDWPSTTYPSQAVSAACNNLDANSTRLLRMGGVRGRGGGNCADCPRTNSTGRPALRPKVIYLLLRFYFLPPPSSTDQEVHGEELLSFGAAASPTPIPHRYWDSARS